METNYWPLVLIVIIPLFFWLRVKAMNMRREMVTARCAGCGEDQKLWRVMNFTCKHCSTDNRFLDDAGIPLASAATYECQACGEKNFVGILTCTACGKGNPAGIPT